MSSVGDTIPRTQRQWQQVRRGLPKDALVLVHNADVPNPQKGEVLVKIAYGTPTPASWKLMANVPVFLRKGAVPELEATGKVVDPNGSMFERGAEVTGALDFDEHFRKGRGVLSDYALFKSENLFPVPSKLTLKTACGLLGSGMTAYKALVEVGKLKPGQRVFINGGTTASGIAAIQEAKIVGAKDVVVSCSAGSFDLVKELGADQAIDYKASPLPAHLAALFSAAPFDLVLDCIGSHDLFAACPAFLKPEGTFVTISIDVPPESSWLRAASVFVQLAMDALKPVWLGGTPRRFVLSDTPVARHRLLDSVRWAGEGKLKVLIDSVYPSNREGLTAAYERGMSGRAKGKILINMEDY